MTDKTRCIIKKRSHVKEGRHLNKQMLQLSNIGHIRHQYYFDCRLVNLSLHLCERRHLKSSSSIIGLSLISCNRRGLKMHDTNQINKIKRTNKTLLAHELRLTISVDYVDTLSTNLQSNLNQLERIKFLKYQCLLIL